MSSHALCIHSGFGFDEPLPDGVRDYALEVRAHPDTFFGAPPDPTGIAWVDRERKLSQADLVTGAGPALRRLVRAGRSVGYLPRRRADGRYDRWFGGPGGGRRC